MHNIIKAQQIKLLLHVDHIWIVLTNNKKLIYDNKQGDVW